jgi:signal transduction histidine kinase
MLGFLRLNPGANLAASLLVIATIVVASLGALMVAGFWVPPGPALLGLIVIYPLWGWRRLQALSSFVSGQAALLTSDLKGSPQKPVGGLDRIAEEASALGRVIGDMRSVRQFMADVIAGFPDPICVADTAGKITLANAAAEQVFGRDAIGQDFDKSLALLTSTRAGSEGEIEALNGKHYLIRRVPFRDTPKAKGGEIIRLADISDLKAAGREREEMLQFLSHDMRAPQAAIIALAEHPDSQAGAWSRVTAFARHTLDLADEFVQLARLRAVGVADETVDIANVMTEAIDMAWTAAKARTISIKSSGIDDPVFVRGDASALTRVFSNLIGNAAKYCPEGSEIQCSLHISGDQAECVVADNGPGLPPERIEHAFTRFGMRSDASGSGLGLAFVKGVVDQHRGDVSVQSSAGKGTRFTITLPLDEEAISAP